LSKTRKYGGLAHLNARAEPRWTGEIRLHDEVVDEPRRWKRPRLVFVNSMSDLFHEQVPADFIRRIFDVMNDCPQHTFQILTKRPGIALSHARTLRWGENIWMGTSIEDDTKTPRADELREIPAQVRFLSLEPLLAPLPSLDLNGIDWVIVGGESGPGAREIKAEWVRDLRDRCATLGVPFFFKQWGGRLKSRNGRELDGRTWDQLPILA
jgi:protein gp37